MSFWDDLRVNAQAAMRGLGEQAGKWGELVQLRGELSSLNRSLSGKYEWVGRLTYQDQVNGTSGSADALIAEITELRTKRQKLERRIAELKKDGEQCDSSGTEPFHPINPS